MFGGQLFIFNGHYKWTVLPMCITVTLFKSHKSRPANVACAKSQNIVLILQFKLIYEILCCLIKMDAV